MARRVRRGSGRDKLSPPHRPEGRPSILLILGVIPILLGALTVTTSRSPVGAILAVVGVIFWILGATGNAIGGRNHWY